MNLHISVLFYWIRKKYPDVLWCNRGYSDMSGYGCPMFPSSLSKTRGHIVVVNADRGVHFVSRKNGELPIFVNCDKSIVNAYGGECFCLFGDISLWSVFNDLQEIFALFQSVNDDLDELIATSHSFDAIIRCCDRVLDEPMALVDTDFRYIAYSREKNRYIEKYVTAEDYLPLELIHSFILTPEYKKLEESRDVFEYGDQDRMFYLNLLFNGKVFGRVSLPFDEQDEEKNGYHRFILGFIGKYITKLYEKMGAFYHREIHNVKMEMMLKELLENYSVDRKELWDLFGSLGYREGDRFCLIRIKAHPSAEKRELTMAVATQLEQLWPGVTCMPYHHCLAVFVNVTYFEAKTGLCFHRELADFLREGLLIAGLSREFSDVQWASKAWKQTSIALEGGGLLDPTYWLYFYDQYALWGILQHGCEGFLPEQICHNALNTLREYDQKNQTVLLETLEVYLREQYNAVAASKKLCVARSTFLKRMERIDALTGIDLEAERERLYLEVSFALFRKYRKEICL